MKQILSLVTALTCFVSVATYAQTGTPQTAITEALTHRIGAKWNCSVITIDHAHITAYHFHHEQYLTGLKRFNAQDLPADFKAAWQEYVSAVSNWVTKTPGAAGVDLSKYVPSGGPLKPGDLVSVLEKVEPEETMQALQHLREVARKNGVDHETLKY